MEIILSSGAVLYLLYMLGIFYVGFDSYIVTINKDTTSRYVKGIGNVPDYSRDKVVSLETVLQALNMYADYKDCKVSMDVCKLSCFRCTFLGRWTWVFNSKLEGYSFNV